MEATYHEEKPDCQRVTSLVFNIVTEATVNGKQRTDSLFVLKFLLQIFEAQFYVFIIIFYFTEIKLFFIDKLVGR